jgi:hypothetical protein
VQSAQVVGPALGGLLYPLSPGVTYGVAAGMCLVAAGCVAAMRHSPAADAAQSIRSAPGLASVLAGIRFVRHTQILLGAILLDLMAVLFGGAVALLPLLALAVSGFVDMFSVNIRSTTVALATPDRLRGRVLAVEMVFISASNQLGAFESGVAAFLVGAVPAVVAGGALTVVIALGWSRLFPALAAVDRLQDLRSVETPQAEASA